MTPNRVPAPMPDNFDELTRTWNDPAAFAREKARYYDQLRLSDELPIDITLPRRGVNQ